MDISKIASSDIFGVHINSLDTGDFLAYLDAGVMAGGKYTVMHVNTHGLNLAYQDLELRRAYAAADLVFFDGFGALWGARFLGYPVTKRITGADWIWDLGEHCSKNGMRLFFLGAREGVAERAAHLLVEHFPALRISSQHGYFDHSEGGSENRTVIEKINKFAPHILVVGMGMPVQEIWLAKNRKEISVSIAITAGAVFDYLAGDLPRAPGWMIRNGFEWLGRLLIEPRRLWKRYVLGNPLFYWRLFAHHYLGLPLPR